MCRSACLLAVLLFLHINAPGEGRPAPPRTLPDGVYAVLREGRDEKDVLPLKDGEALAVHRPRSLKEGEREPPRHLVVRAAPDVVLALASPPKAEREGGVVVRILLKLEPKAAAALARLTSGNVGGQVTVNIGGEVVTVHKIREAIKGGEVQITSCAPGAADHLLGRLKALHKKG